MNGDQVQATGGNFQEIVAYVDVEYANSFMAANLVWGEWWSQGTDAQKGAALQQATVELDQLVYIGRKLYVNQQREWPRYLDLRSYGDIYNLQEAILPDVARATCIQAAYILKNFLLGHDHKGRQNHQQQGLSSIQRVGANESYDHAKARRHQLCREAYEILIPYLSKTGNMEDPFDTYHRPYTEPK